jgi:hypothetical protein
MGLVLVVRHEAAQPPLWSMVAEDPLPRSTSSARGGVAPTRLEPPSRTVVKPPTLVPKVLCSR